jgi:predicted PurR-regulated permease PerM
MMTFDRIAKIVVMTLLIALIAVGFTTSLVLAIDVYLLIFLAILCGVMFANVAKWIGRLAPIPYGVNLAIAVAAFVGIAIVTLVLFGLRIEEQVARTSSEVDQSFTRVEDWLNQHPPIKTAIGRVPLIDDLLNDDEPGGDKPSQEPQSSADGRTETEESSSERRSEPTNKKYEQTPSTGWSNVDSMSSISGRVFGVLGKVFSTTFGIAMNVAFVLFVGVFLAIKPHWYRDKFALLFPSSTRSRVSEILDDIGETLWNWLQGRVATMFITGVGTGIVLWLLGIPLAFTLGVITGLLTFIPNIGGILALMLAMLVALSQGPSTVMWVVIAYGVLQFIESNVVTPLIQQHQTSVPPPVLLSAQLMMGVMTGFLGVLVATPLVAATIVVVRDAYVNDVLGDKQTS